MAESTDRRVRKTPEEKLSELQSKNRMGMDEIALQLGCRLPHLKLTAKVGREILDTFLELVKESLKGGRNVVFPGFGSFVVKERKARRVRNPSPGINNSHKPDTLIRCIEWQRLSQRLKVPTTETRIASGIQTPKRTPAVASRVSHCAPRRLNKKHFLLAKKCASWSELRSAGLNW